MSFSHDSTFSFECQESFLVSAGSRVSASDFNDTEVIEKFTPKKAHAVLLSQSYARLAVSHPDLVSRVQRVYECGSLLEFRKSVSDFQNDSVKYKLHFANFCRDRLCPLCAWRRSMKIYGQVSQIMNCLCSDDSISYVFLTLTVPSCSGFELPDLISKMQSGFARLRNYKRFGSFLGFFRTLEITRNNKRRSKSYGLYHPHFHCILAVKSSYFSSKDYIKHSEFLDLWRKAMRDESITQVHVTRIKPGSEAFQAGCDVSEYLHNKSAAFLLSAVREVAKYSIKSSDYIFEDNSELTDEIVFTLFRALYCRRMVAFGGLFEDIRKKLFSDDDSEDGDLIHVGEDFDEIRPDVAYMIKRFHWSSGVYRLIDDEVVGG